MVVTGYSVVTVDGRHGVAIASAVVPLFDLAFVLLACGWRLVHLRQMTMWNRATSLI